MPDFNFSASLAENLRIRQNTDIDADIAYYTISDIYGRTDLPGHLSVCIGSLYIAFVCFGINKAGGPI